MSRLNRFLAMNLSTLAVHYDRIDHTHAQYGDIMLGHLSIQKSTSHITVQDLGRWGHQHLGVSSGGAADKYALRWANHLLDNDGDCAVLEFFLGNCTMFFNEATYIAITGADCKPKLNGLEIPPWSTCFVPAGSTLQLFLPRSGLYSYLAISDGFTIDNILGSASTTIRESIGPNNGKALATGDVLHYSKSNGAKRKRSVHWSLVPDYNAIHEIRFIPSTFSSTVLEHTLKQAQAASYTIAPTSNKMGIRLQGNTLDLEKNTPYSEGVVEGSIQIPPNGQPIVLMADHQTIGGYPLLGTVYSVDISGLSQRRPGQTIIFKEGNMEEAQNTLLKQHSLFKTA